MGLSYEAPDLAARLSAAPEAVQRAFARSAARLAIEYTGIGDEPTLAEALARLEDTDCTVDPDLRARVTDVVARLDARQYELEERLEQTQPGVDDEVPFAADHSSPGRTRLREQYHAAHAQARAADAVLRAMTNDALEAALDAGYEALAALERLDLLQDVGETILQRAPSDADAVVVPHVAQRAAVPIVQAGGRSLVPSEYVAAFLDFCFDAGIRVARIEEFELAGRSGEFHRKRVVDLSTIRDPAESVVAAKALLESERSVNEAGFEFALSAPPDWRARARRASRR